MEFDGAACVGINVDMFYSEDGDVDNQSQLKRMCAECPVLDACLEWSLHREVYGYWAGMNKSQRKRARRLAGIPEPSYQSEDYVDVGSIRARTTGNRVANDAA